MTKAKANQRVKAVLGERAYAYMLFKTVNVWLRNEDRALDPAHTGPLMAAQGQSYAEAVAKVERGEVFENARAALDALASKNT